MGTGARGEGYLGDLPVLFTNRALAEAERVLGRTVTDLFKAAAVGSLGVEDTVRLLAIGLEYGRRDRKEARANYTKDDAFGVMDIHGFTQVGKVVFEAMEAVLSYEEKPDDPPE
jgi:hypothetical protein